MARDPVVLIPGGSGVFGAHLARELLRTTPARLLLAGRNRARLLSACRMLDAGDRARPVVLDLADPEALEHVAAGCVAVACAAGPFQALPRELPEAAIRAGAHWLDIADDQGWVLPLLRNERLSQIAESAGRVVCSGLSTTPALSGVLARWCHARLPGSGEGRLTLYIGNRNAKGSGAIASALSVGPAHLSQVVLPVGRRSAYRFPSADSALLRQNLDMEAIFQVAFEWQAVTRLMTLLAPLARRLPLPYRSRLAHALSSISGPLNRFGSDTGCIQAELWNGKGEGLAASFVGAGQRLAILPCALAIERLLSGDLTQRGVIHPAEWLSPEEWIEALGERGIEFVTQTRSRASQ